MAAEKLIRKQSREQLGYIRTHTITLRGKETEVFDVRKRYHENGKPKEKFKRCYTLPDAEQALAKFSEDTAQFRLFAHGHTSLKNGRWTPTYKSYASAKDRCTNPNCVGYKYYGARGIEFRFQSFNEFLEEVGLRADLKLTLDRINVNGHYEKGNVRWATKSEQIKNQRRNIKD